MTREKHELIAREVNRWSAKQRAPFLLRWSGMRRDEIAEQLGITVNNEKYHQKKAYEALRLAFKDMFTGDFPEEPPEPPGNDGRTREQRRTPDERR